MRRKLLIVGAGGFAREAFSWVRDQDAYEPFAFLTTQNAPVDSIYGLTVMKSFDRIPNALKKELDYLIAFGDPDAKMEVADLAFRAGLTPCQPIIHPTATLGHETSIGLGTIICPNVVVSTGVRIWEHVLLNLGTTVGHDTEIGNFTTVSPGANISGMVEIGAKSYVGTGASIRDDITIGRSCIIGMGAVVTKSVPSQETWVGNPAKRLFK